jgi:hypothetical protein
MEQMMAISASSEAGEQSPEQKRDLIEKLLKAQPEKSRQPMQRPQIETPLIAPLAALATA